MKHVSFLIIPLLNFAVFKKNTYTNFYLLQIYVIILLFLGTLGTTFNTGCFPWLWWCNRNQRQRELLIIISSFGLHFGLIGICQVQRKSYKTFQGNATFEWTITCMKTMFNDLLNSCRALTIVTKYVLLNFEINKK